MHIRFPAKKSGILPFFCTNVCFLRHRSTQVGFPEPHTAPGIVALCVGRVELVERTRCFVHVRGRQDTPFSFVRIHTTPWEYGPQYLPKHPSFSAATTLSLFYVCRSEGFWKSSGLLAVLHVHVLCRKKRLLVSEKYRRIGLSKPWGVCAGARRCWIFHAKGSVRVLPRPRVAGKTGRCRPARPSGQPLRRLATKLLGGDGVPPKTRHQQEQVDVTHTPWCWAIHSRFLGSTAKTSIRNMRTRCRRARGVVLPRRWDIMVWFLQNVRVEAYFLVPPHRSTVQKDSQPQRRNKPTPLPHSSPNFAKGFKGALRGVDTG